MDVPINYLAVLVAAIINMALGMAWYGPLFGKYWMRVIGHTDEDRMRAMSGEGRKAMMRSTLIGFILALISNYVLAHFIVFAASYNGMTGAAAGAICGFWLWLGFMLLATSGSYLWEMKAAKLWAVYAGYYLVILLVNGALLGGWM
jgi:hypothetical protein